MTHTVEFLAQTFTLHDDLVPLVSKALEKARSMARFEHHSVLNQNKNGAALSLVIEAFLG